MKIDSSAFKYEKRKPEHEVHNERKSKESAAKRSHSDEVNLSSSPPISSNAVPKTNKKRATNRWPGPSPPISEPNSKIVFVGFNPGMESARLGHYYAHPSNRFWKFLFWSKLTRSLHTPFQDRRMPELYKIGFTDLVARATKGITQLNKQEMLEGVKQLDDRIADVEPDVVCFVGKGIWQCVARSYGWSSNQFTYGLDAQHKFGHDKSILYCVASTSGLNSISVEKQSVPWKQLYAEINANSSPPPEPIDGKYQPGTP